MRKSLTMLLVLVFISLICTQAFAATNPEVILEKEEIKDLNILWQRASCGVSDIKSDIDNFRAELKNAPVNMVVEKKATTQILKKVKRTDGNVETYYATTFFTILKDKDKDVKKSASTLKLASLNSVKLPIMVAASKGWDEYDDSYSIRHVGTFYYSSYRDSNTILWVRPEKVEAKWYRADSSVSISSSRYGAEWLGYNTSGKWCGREDYSNPLPMSWGKLYTNTISNDGYINCTVAGCYVVGEQRDTLTRGGSSWESLSGYLFGENMSAWPS